MAVLAINPVAKADPSEGPPSRSEGRSRYVFPILRLGAGPRFELDGRHGGEWHVRAGVFLAQRVGRSGTAPWYRLEADFGYLKNEHAQAFGGGVVGLFGPIGYFQAGYSVRFFAERRDDFALAVRHGLATRFFGGLLSLDVEHERVPAREDSAIIVMISLDLGALGLAASVLTGGGR